MKIRLHKDWSHEKQIELRNPEYKLHDLINVNKKTQKMIELKKQIASSFQSYTVYNISIR